MEASINVLQRQVIALAKIVVSLGGVLPSDFSDYGAFDRAEATLKAAQRRSDALRSSTSLNVIPGGRDG